MVSDDAKLAQALEVTPELLPFMPALLADLWAIGSWPREIVETLRNDSVLPFQPKVLDLCCGKGAVGIPLARELGCQVHGIDIFPPFIEEARARANAAGVPHLCQFEIGDVHEMIREARDYDVAVLAGVGCGVFGGFAGSVEQMRRCVRTSGYLVIDDGFLSRAKRLGRPGYEYYRSHEETTRELLAHETVLLQETLIPNERFHTYNQTTTELISQRATGLAVEHPELAEQFRALVERERTECRLLETETQSAVWLLRRC